jgi:hypothetical protein
MKRALGIAMIALGALMLVGLVVFIVLLLDYRHSFTYTDVPIWDFLQGLALLSPAVIIAGVLIYFGVRWQKS